MTKRTDSQRSTVKSERHVRQGLAAAAGRQRDAAGHLVKRGEEPPCPRCRAKAAAAAGDAGGSGTTAQPPELGPAPDVGHSDPPASPPDPSPAGRRRVAPWFTGR